jgi:FkbM family methyltransferase
MNSKKCLSIKKAENYTEYLIMKIGNIFKKEELKKINEEIYQKWKNMPIEEKIEFLKHDNVATPEAIFWGYKLILGRDPENLEVLKGNSGPYSLNVLRDNMITCREFIDKYEKIKVDPEVLIIEKKIKDGVLRIETKDELLLWQTSDKEKYWPMLQETSKTIYKYAQNHPIHHEKYIGIKRGVWPWQATHNRIYKLNELIDNNYKGWFLYIDADAFISDFNFSFLNYLKDKKEYGFIAAEVPEPKGFWDFNIGILLVNLGHPIARCVIRRWKTHYDEKYTESDYIKADQWNMIDCDQAAFHQIIKNSAFKKYIYTEGTKEIFNAKNAKIISQLVREAADSSCYNTLESRIEMISSKVNEVLDKDHIHDQSFIHSQVNTISDSKAKLDFLHKRLRICHGSFRDELKEQEIFSEFIESSMIVLEIGANVGRSTLIIASLLESDKSIVSVESDITTASKLRDNLLINNYDPQIINAALSKRNLIQKGWDTKPSDVIEAGWSPVPIITLEEIKSKFTLDFNTLVLDCEGAFYYILLEFPEILDNIKTIIIENDFKEVEHQEYVDNQLILNGFKSIYRRSAPYGHAPERFHEVWKK